MGQLSIGSAVNVPSSQGPVSYFFLELWTKAADIAAVNLEIKSVSHNRWSSTILFDYLTPLLAETTGGWPAASVGGFKHQ